MAQNSGTDVSLIISFYNDTLWLNLILAALEKQTYNSFEVVIADDGSGKEAQQIIAEAKDKHSFPIQHKWHEDDGWRKNIILNKAIVTSKSPYLIFIDGDCIPHKHFIKEHFFNREKKTILAGRRVNLSARISENLTADKIQRGYLEQWLTTKLFIHKIFFHDGSHPENGIYVSSKIIRSRLNRKNNKGILGSNFSIHKADILALNGFDERYLLPAVGEDTDINHRAVFAGLKVKTLKHLALQYHKHHKKLIRDRRNLQILQQTIDDKLTFTPYGIIKEEK